MKTNFNVETVFLQALRQLLNMKRQHFTSIDSTQSYAKANLSDYALGQWYVVTADEQTDGVGTHQRHWHSPAGDNVYATFIYIVEKPADRWLMHLSQLVSLSVAQVMLQYQLPIRIKWPNDVLINGSKIAGVLAESQTVKRNDKDCVALFLGVGINVNMDEQQCQAIDQAVTSMQLITGVSIDREQVLSKISHQLENNIALFLAKGFSPMLMLLNDLLETYDNKPINFTTAQQQIVQGTILGIDEAGQLRLQVDGQEQQFHSGSISPL